LRIVIDIEANGFNPSKIWVVVCKDIDTNQYHIFRKITDDNTELHRLADFLSKCELVIGHNYLGYDGTHLKRLAGIEVPVDNVLDTLIVSKLADYPRRGHSIEDYGEEFNLEKITFNDFSKYSEDMERYCIRDVDICHRIYDKYRRYINKPEHTKSLKLEHHFQLVTNQLHDNGFAFNTKKATELLGKVTAELEVLDRDILSSFPPREVLIREFTPKATKFGTISKSSIPRVLHDRIIDYEIGKTYRHTKFEAFNPSSHKQIINILNEAEWRPVDKTQTHIDTEREIARLRYKTRTTELDILYQELYSKLQSLQKTGWKDDFIFHKF